MRRVIFALGVLFVFACSKTEVPATPPVVVIQEEAIKFTTNLDTGTYNVADTLQLVVTVSSKLPSAGLLYSILVNWTDSSKQIFKLDTSLTTSSLSLNIPGLKKTGSYSISLIVTSKSTSSNSLNKSISVVNNPLGRFMGYKVDQVSNVSIKFVFRTGKTGEISEIPAFETLIKIAEKYNYNFPEPVHDTVVLKEIKEICKLIPSMNITVEKKYTKGGQNKRDLLQKYQRIVIHTARRSLATVLVENGLKHEQVMKITGHKKLLTLQRYVKSGTDIDQMLEIGKKIKNG